MSRIKISKYYFIFIVTFLIDSKFSKINQPGYWNCYLIFWSLCLRSRKLNDFWNMYNIYIFVIEYSFTLHFSFQSTRIFFYINLFYVLPISNHVISNPVLYILSNFYLAHQSFLTKHIFEFFRLYQQYWRWPIVSMWGWFATRNSKQGYFRSCCGCF